MKFWQVDAFTDRIFHGNPAGVFITRESIADDIQQKIAMEMNLSETAFVVLGEKQNNIRWFTPKIEVDLCGHATLAAAHILWQQDFIEGDMVSFQSRSGLLSVTRQASGYTLDFPSQPPLDRPDYQKRVAEIIGAQPIYIGSNGGDCLVVLENHKLVENAVPDLAKIEELAERGLVLTAQDKTGHYDYIYRAFFPKLDIPEDPVTGSANTQLGPYWAKVLGKQKLSAYQASQRGGSLTVEMMRERVLISGQAVTVFEGEFGLNG